MGVGEGIFKVDGGGSTFCMGEWVGCGWLEVYFG